jgi:hypothetical protein
VLPPWPPSSPKDVLSALARLVLPTSLPTRPSAPARPSLRFDASLLPSHRPFVPFVRAFVRFPSSLRSLVRVSLPPLPLPFGLFDFSTFGRFLRSSIFALRSSPRSLPLIPPCMPRVIYRKEVCAMTRTVSHKQRLASRRNFRATPEPVRRKKKDSKRTQISALAPSKTRFPSKKRTQPNPPPRCSTNCHAVWRVAFGSCRAGRRIWSTPGAPKTRALCVIGPDMAMSPLLDLPRSKSQRHLILRDLRGRKYCQNCHLFREEFPCAADSGSSHKLLCLRHLWSLRESVATTPESALLPSIP